LIFIQVLTKINLVLESKLIRFLTNHGCGTMDDDLRVLVLGDEESPEDLIDYEFSKSKLRILALRVTTIESFCQNLQDNSPNLILVTTGCRGISALTAFALAQEICPGIPCFLINSTTEQPRNPAERASRRDQASRQVQGWRLESAISGFFEALGTTALVGADPEASFRAKEAMQPLMQVAGVIIVLLSPEGNILEFNLGAECLTGWSRLEILGKDGIKLCFPEGHQNSARVHLKRVLTGVAVDSIDLPLQVRDGSTPAYRWYCNLIFDGRGKPGGVMLVGQPLADAKPWQSPPRARLARCSPAPAVHQGRGLLTRRTGTC
jgi:PAS domain S-box-containing protein